MWLDWHTALSSVPTVRKEKNKLFCRFKDIIPHPPPLNRYIRGGGVRSYVPKQHLHLHAHMPSSLITLDSYQAQHELVCARIGI